VEESIKMRIIVISRLKLLQNEKHLHLVGCILFSIFLVCGCSIVPADRDPSAEQLQRRVFVLKQITANQAKIFLSRSGFDTISCVPVYNTLLVEGSPHELVKVDAILDLVDANEKYVIKDLAPASTARDLPSNEQIAGANLQNLTE
jgi:hypothetical protein